MMHLRRERGFRLALTGTIFVALAGIAAAECPIQPTGGVIYACANKRTGHLRCIAPAEGCRKTERLLVWNVQDASGARPAQGVRGAETTPGTDATQTVPGSTYLGSLSSGAIRG